MGDKSELFFLSNFRIVDTVSRSDMYDSGSGIGCHMVPGYYFVRILPENHIIGNGS